MLTPFFTLTSAGIAAAGGALLASPAFTGTPTAPTATVGTNTTQLATTAFVLANAPGAPVSSVSNSDGTLTVSPTTGGVVASLALGHANTWTGVQTLSPAARTSGSAPYLTINAPADTTLAAGAECIGVSFVGNTCQFATGNITTQRGFVFGAPTYGFVGASTITTAVGAEFASPLPGTLAVLTKSIGLRCVASAAAHVPIVVKGAASQSANLQEWQNSSGTAKAVIDAAGNMALGNATTTAFAGYTTLTLDGSDTGEIEIKKNGIAKAYLYADGTGAVWSAVSGQDSSFYAGGVDRFHILSSGLVGINKSSSMGGQLHIVTGGNSVKGLIVQGSSSQSGSLQELQKSDATVLYKFDNLARPVTAGTTPTIAANAGAGTSPTISIAGTDVNGVITLTAGTLPTGGSSVLTVTFSSAYGAAPKTVILTPANGNAAALTGLTMVYAGTITTTTWDVIVGATGLGAATQYLWYYEVLG